MKRKMSYTGKAALALTLSLVLIASSMFLGGSASAGNIAAQSAVRENTVQTAAAEPSEVRQTEPVSEPEQRSDHPEAAEASETLSEQSYEPHPEAAVKTEAKSSAATQAKKSLPAVSGEGDSSLTVYFDNTVNWEKVKIHYWGNESSQWPGNDMNYDSSLGLYYYTLSSMPTGIIFNNGNSGDGNQTGDITSGNIVDGNVYVFNTAVDKCNTGKTAQVYSSEHASSYYTIYFKAPYNATSANMYTWSVSGDSVVEYNGNWDNATPMAYDSIYRLYYSKVSTNVQNVIFKYTLNDGTSDKTADLRLGPEDNGHFYEYDAAKNSHSTTYPLGSVEIWAKTGTIRTFTGSTSNLNSGTYDKYSKLSDIVSLVYDEDPENDLTEGNKLWNYDTTLNGASASGYRLADIKYVERNKLMRYTVQIKPDYRRKYYIKAFNINGETYNVIDQSEADLNEGLYSCEFIITNKMTGPIEITPIYYNYVYPGDEDKYITFSAEDFAGDVRKLWSNTLSCYAYYVGGRDEETTSDPDPDGSSKNALGGYPGQPMVYINGSYYMQIPKKVGSGVIQGITLNNYVWEDIHARKVLGKSTNDELTLGEVQQANCQTYDYDDFVAIRDTRGAERIIFSFKFRTANTHSDKTDDPTMGNLSSGFDIANVESSGNGWDVLVDYYDIPVDLFGRRIVDGQSQYITDTYVKNLSSEDKVYVVSDGYVAYYNRSSRLKEDGKTSNEYVGQFATRWYVYKKSGNSYNVIGALPPSAFLTGLKNPDTLAKTYETDESAYTRDNFLNYGDAAITGEGNSLSTWEDYEKIYQACAGMPVVITYESNIFSAGAKNGNETITDNNPGYRCDGRWYYSKPNNVITGETKIMIRTENPESADGYDYKLDEYTTDASTNEKTNVGTLTKARACFTNTTLDAYGMSYFGKTKTTVYEDESDSFRFKADGTSIGTSLTGASDVTYRFVGWYLETGSDLINIITEDINGQRQMDAFANLVAVYEEVQPQPTRTLIVTHELYSDLYENSTGLTTVPGNGTGTPYIDSVIVRSADGSVVRYSDFQKMNGSVMIEPQYLNEITDEVVINLSTTPANDDTSFNKVYRTAADSDGNTGFAEVDRNSGNKISFTYKVSDIFGNNTEPSIVRLPFYSDLSTSMLKVNFKYYDREVSSTSAPETISQSETVVPIMASAKVDNTASIYNAIVNALGTPSNISGNPVISTIGNDIDDYYFWATQSDAVNGVKNLKNYHDYDDTTEGSSGIEQPEGSGTEETTAEETPYDMSKFKTYGESYKNELNKLDFHLDCYGQPMTENTEAWVSYMTVNGQTVTYNSAEQVVDLTEVAYVTVWGYNAPKKYSVELSKPKTELEGDYSWETNGDGISFAQSSSAEIKVVETFYNQRLGGKDTSVENSSANTNSDFLTAYGIKSYVGLNDAVTAPEKVDGKVFDGWYNADDGSKITSDRTYGYRVTSDLRLIAGYRTESADPGSVGVSVTSNDVGTYVDGNGDDWVRLVTNVNIFNNIDGEGKQIDSDDKITKVSSIYVQLPTRTEEGTAIKWTPEMLASLGLDTFSSVENGKTVKDMVNDYIHSDEFTKTDTPKGKTAVTIKVKVNGAEEETEFGKTIITYTYEVVEGTPSDDQINLTNKNRIQFTLPMRAEYYNGITAEVDNETVVIPGSNSAIIAYAAILYDTAAENADPNLEWILSDNHAEFINDVCLPSIAPKDGE